MKNVNIYLKNQNKGPRRQSRKGIYILERITNAGPATYTGFIKTEDCSQNKADILILIKALEHLKMPVALAIYTSNPYVAAVLGKDNKHQELWKNQKGEPLSNTEEWQKVDKLLKEHTYEVHTGKHSYLDWMMEQIKE
ncbi:MAG: hypothetical protein IKK59_05690 [Lachnospiraceae bacterium]|nr:hypothetical protein [Lachnospiraceae bacterium]